MPTIEVAQKLINARQFSEWQAFYRLEPFGDEWRQAATLAALYANSKSKQRFAVDDFLPVKPTKVEQSFDGIVNTFAAAGVKVKRNGDDS